MACNVEPCNECAQNCLLIHGKKRDSSSSVVTSFFKVMIGDDFSDVLFLPPIFAQRIWSHYDQKIYLEDSTGERWKVTVSIVDGSLAFQRGWNAFSLDHGLDIGDFLVFHYIMGPSSHFVVHIYGKSGCQSLDFPKSYSSRKKRNSNRDIRNPVAKHRRFHTPNKAPVSTESLSTSIVSVSDDGLSQSQPMTTENTSTSQSRNQNGKSGFVSGTTCFEEQLIYMMDIDERRGKQGEDRSSLLDLSSFEMQRDKPGHTVATAKEKNSVEIKDVPEIPMVEKMKISITNNKMVENDAGGASSAGNLPKPPIAAIIKNGNSHSELRSGDFGLSSQRKDAPPMRITRSSLQQKVIGISNVSLNRRSGKTRAVIKKEQSEEIHPDKMKREMEPKILKAVKAEPVHSVDVSPVEADISCLAMDNQSFLELPTSLISGRTKSDRTVIFLRDRYKQRLWPVLYQEKGGLNVLTSGWQLFSKANGIHTGDQCVFKVEDKPEFIFRVSILSK